MTPRGSLNICLQRGKTGNIIARTGLVRLGALQRHMMLLIAQLT
jgi:hypothetical protein